MGSSVVLVASDLHYGKVTPEYDVVVFMERMDRLASYLTELRKDDGKKASRLVIFILGDVNDGTDIYRGQPHYQAVSDVEKQAMEFASYMWSWLSRLADVWKTVEVFGICGNHGRAGKTAHERANWDLVAYRYMDLGNRDDRIKIWHSKDEMFMRTVELHGHGYLLYHGHEILQYQTVPWYGILQRVLRWNNSQRLGNWKVVLMGHFHTVGYWLINETHIMLTGTLVSGDDWGFRRYGTAEQCKWWVFGCDNDEPVTWLRTVRLD